MRALLFAALFVSACSPAPTTPTIAPVAKHREAAAPSVCSEPTTISPVAAKVLASDPVTAPEWRRGNESGSVTDGARRYEMSAEGAISATDSGKTLWSVPAVQVAGGAFGLMLSPKGSVVVRSYSRGGLELFDANEGRLVRKVGAATPSFDDRFVVEVPHVQFGLETWDHLDVRYVPLDPKQPVRSIVKLPLKEGVFPQFGATVCSTGSLIAVSFPTTELAVYRTSDLQRLAGVPNPGPGEPAFTRSGRYIVLRDGDELRAMFELVY